MKLVLLKNVLALHLKVILLLKNINELCRKGNLKLHALTRCAKFMSTEKRHLIFKVFIIPQFIYYPLVWMFHAKQLKQSNQ